MAHKHRVTQAARGMAPPLLCFKIINEQESLRLDVCLFPAWSRGCQSRSRCLPPAEHCPSFQLCHLHHLSSPSSSPCEFWPETLRLREIKSPGQGGSAGGDRAVNPTSPCFLSGDKFPLDTASVPLGSQLRRLALCSQCAWLAFPGSRTRPAAVTIASFLSVHIPI